jgi:hypothetical protein
MVEPKYEVAHMDIDGPLPVGWRHLPFRGRVYLRECQDCQQAFLATRPETLLCSERCVRRVNEARLKRDRREYHRQRYLALKDAAARLREADATVRSTPNAEGTTPSS